jgi:uncharacterized Zn finger protein (UPF0148 family)
MTTEGLNCPKCGAPLPVTPKQRVAICLYCGSSVHIAVWPDADTSETGQVPSPTAVMAEIPKEVAERVKQMVVDGKRAAAIRFYAEQTGISSAEAEIAVNQLVFPLVEKLTAHMSLDVGWVLLFLAFLAGLASALVWTIRQVLRGSIEFGLLAVLLGIMLYAGLRWFIPKVISTWVRIYGREAHARILKSTAIQPLRKRGMLVLLLMEVQPINDEPSFQSEEGFLIYVGSLPKLQPGNVVRVRYARGGLDRVDLSSPIEVLETGK